MLTSEKNHPGSLWKIGDLYFSVEEWENAYHSLKSGFCAPEDSLLSFVNGRLLEKQFGQSHWHLNFYKKLYYRLKPCISSFVQTELKHIYRFLQEKRGISGVKSKNYLKWPIEDYYVNFQQNLIRHLMDTIGLSEIEHIAFWPHNKNFTFVLTHDVETERGLKNLPHLLELEKKFGFRSVINIIPERYPIDIDYLEKLRSEGFEIGIHGLKHDGKLFFTNKTFSKRAKKINEYFKQYGAVGFRSPLTHRNPIWMQELQCDYDMSFFDTDPYETIPGGTMSIWPFFIGRFIELPITVPQDSTLFITLKERDINIWIKKINWIEKNKGMVLLNVHPDYIDFKNKWERKKYPFKLYEELLSYIINKKNFWHALPREVVMWWRYRANCVLKEKDGKWVIDPPLQGARIGIIKLKNGKLVFKVHLPIS